MLFSCAVLQDNFAVNKELKLEQLEKLYEKNLKHVGEAHVAAVQEVERTTAIYLTWSKFGSI